MSGRCHIGHYNREMLKLRFPIREQRPDNCILVAASQRANHLVTQVQVRYSHLSLGKSDQLCETRIDLWRVRNAREAEGACIKLRQPFQLAAD